MARELNQDRKTSGKTCPAVLLWQNPCMVQISTGNEVMILRELNVEQKRNSLVMDLAHVKFIVFDHYIAPTNQPA